MKPHFFGNNGINNFLIYTSILSGIFIITGLVFTVLMVINKEKQDYKYWISIVGFPLLLIAEVSKNF